MIIILLFSKLKFKAAINPMDVDQLNYLVNLIKCLVSYVARVRFGIRVRVRVQDSAIFEKGGCGCDGTRRLKNY